MDIKLGIHRVSYA